MPRETDYPPELVMDAIFTAIFYIQNPKIIEKEKKKMGQPESSVEGEVVY